MASLNPGDKVRVRGPLEQREQPLVGRVGVLVKLTETYEYRPLEAGQPLLWRVGFEDDAKTYPLFEDEMERVD